VITGKQTHRWNRCEAPWTAAACCRFGRDSLLSGRPADEVKENVHDLRDGHAEAAAGCMASKRQQAAAIHGLLAQPRDDLVDFYWKTIQESPHE